MTTNVGAKRAIGGAGANSMPRFSWFLLLSLILCPIASFSHPPPPGKPDVTYFVTALPETSIRENILTQRPEAIDLTVVRVRTDDVFRSLFAKGINPADELDSFAVPVWQHHDVATAALLHSIDIPPLPIGLYEVRIASVDRTAIQRLDVGTLEIATNLAPTNSLISAIDLRTKSRRSDISVLLYDKGTLRSYRPDSNGFIHFTYGSTAHVNAIPGDDILVTTASDGSAVVQKRSWGGFDGIDSYFETDRQIYRPGDHVYVRSISRSPSDSPLVRIWNQSKEYLVQLTSAERGHSGSFILPSTARAGFYDTGNKNGSFFVTDSRRSRYEIELGVRSHVVTEGSTVRVILSVHTLDGRPVRTALRFAWCTEGTDECSPIEMRTEDGLPHGPLYQDTTGTAITDSDGNATVTFTAQGGYDMGFFVYDPDTSEVAAMTELTIVSRNDNVGGAATTEDMPEGCTPLAFNITDADGNPVKQGRLRVSIHPWMNPSDLTVTPKLQRNLTTGPGGIAIMRWCHSIDGDYEITADEIGRSSFGYYTIVRVRANARPRYSQLLFIAPQTKPIPPRKPAPMLATSQIDGDAIVLYGSGATFQTATTVFKNGIARFQIPPPANEDDFRATVQLLSGGGARSTLVRVSEKRHLLHIAISCAGPVYHPGDTARLCVRVRDWRGRDVPSVLYASITQASLASIVSAQEKVDDPYLALYTPGNPNEFSFSAEPVKVVTSYLNPILSQKLSPNPTTSANHSSPPQKSETPAPAFPAQTLLWLDNISTISSGFAAVQFQWPSSAIPGTYLIHIIATGANGSIGDNYAWVRLSTSERP